jgi:tetratricopeptide (TPR) repeat protein
MVGIDWLFFGIAHAISCLIFSIVCFLHLPVKYKHHKKLTLSFFCIFNFALPVIGVLGSLMALVYPLHTPKTKHEVTWKASEKFVLPDKPGEFSLYQYSSGSLQGILLHHNDVSKREEVVRAARHLPAKASVPLFKIAISDTSDDVRLLAFAALESIETAINKNLLESKRSFSANPTQSEAFDIAQQYWELCYLGIASSALHELYLKNAKRYLEKAEAIAPSSSAKLLLGRVLTAQGDPSMAINLFSQALEQGANIKQVAPYLAEAAYDAKQYSQVKQCLAHIPGHTGNKLSQVKEYWS